MPVSKTNVDKPQDRGVSVPHAASSVPGAMAVRDTASTVPGAMAIDGEASKKEKKKGKGLSRFSGASGRAPRPTPPSTLSGAVAVEGSSTAQGKNGKGLSRFSADLAVDSATQEKRNTDSGLESVIQPARIKRGLSQGSPTGSADSELQNAKRQVRSTDSGVEIARQPMRSKMVLTQNPTPESADFGLEEAQQEPSYMRYVSADAADEKAKYESGNTAVPGYIGYIGGTSEHRSSGVIDKIHIRQFPNSVSVDQLQHNIASFPTETASGVAAGTPHLRRGPGITNLPEPGAYPGGIDMVDVDDWLEDGYLDREPTEEISSQAAQQQPQPSMDTAGLAVANPVSQQFSLDLNEAQFVDPELRLQKREDQKTKSRTLLTAMLVIACLVVGGIVLALVFAINLDGNTEISREETNETLAPTSEEDLFVSLLPSHTIKAIYADESSPQARALAWLTEDPNLTNIENWRKIQRFALATFFFSTGGELKNGEAKGKWLTKTHWLSYNHSECEWFASNHVGPSQPESVEFGLIDSYPPLLYESGLCSIDETSNGRVERLVFFSNGLKGELPPELSLLTELRGFATVANPVTGTIPSEIGLMTNLEFFTSVVGKLQGSLPSELGNARNLTHLICFRNQVSGGIPTQVGALTSLKALVLDENKLEGTLPTELGLLSNAIWITSYNNHYTGGIPTQLGQLSSVRLLGAWNNPLQGSLPSQLGLLSSMQELNFQGSHLTGTLPTELGQLQALEKVYLVANEFSGQIPSELGLLQNLWYINLGNSLITGTIPLEFILAPQMRVLLLYGAQLTGSIPTQIGLSTHMTNFVPSVSNITGTIPTEIGLLSDLREFALQHTDITGQIPSQLGLLKLVDHVSLQDTKISGSIPTEIGLASSIRRLVLYETDITGPIPSQLGLLTMLKHLNLNDTPMSGDIPSELGAPTSLSFLGLRRAGNKTVSSFLPTELCALPARIEVDCDAVQCPDDCNCDCKRY